jgi:hypothetical protein
MVGLESGRAERGAGKAHRIAALSPVDWPLFIPVAAIGLLAAFVMLIMWLNEPVSK